MKLFLPCKSLTKQEFPSPLPARRNRGRVLDSGPSVSRGTRVPHPPGKRVIVFGVFELDLDARDLRKAGRRIRIAPQPFQLLATLLERPGEVVTREELRQRL